MQYIVNLRARLAKDKALNRILPQLQRQFEDRLSIDDELPALEPGDYALIQAIIEEELAEAL